MRPFDKIVLMYSMLLVILTGLVSADWFSTKHLVANGGTKFFDYYTGGILVCLLIAIILFFSLAIQQFIRRKLRWTILLPIADVFIIYLNVLVWRDMLW
jgi:hypothetical protein